MAYPDSPTDIRPGSTIGTGSSTVTVLPPGSTPGPGTQYTWVQGVPILTTAPGASPAPTSTSNGDPVIRRLPAEYSSSTDPNPATTILNPGSNPATATDPNAVTNAVDAVNSAYPWLSQMGLGPQLQQWVVQGLGPDAIVSQIRQTSQYQAMFPAIRRSDGTMRMNESAYLSTQDQYKQLMQQYGIPGTDYGAPSNYVGLFENEIDPNEFKQRLDTYDQIGKSSAYTKAAFYVYAGMNVSTDQLYQALVDPQAQANMTSEYNQRVALAPPDYQTFIQRATEFALSQAGDQAATTFGSGSATAQTLQNIDPTTAQTLMDNLYHGLGYNGVPTEPVEEEMARPSSSSSAPLLLNLNQLLSSFQNALIGGAAAQNGLVLPTQDRVEQFRQAGISQAAALQAYGQIGTQGNAMTGALQRSGLGTSFSQDQLENALLLKTTPDLDLLQRAEASDKALQEAGGGFNFSSNQNTGLLSQRGLRPSLA